MQLDGDDLLEQIRKDFPVQYELSSLRLLVAKQAEEIERLTAAPQSVYPRPYDAEVPRDSAL